jgi:hypothetical protein
MSPPRPVFIIGSPRSGTSVLTWALGQHPNLLPVEETRWLQKLAVDLRATYQLGRQATVSQLASMGIDMRDFYDQFGSAVNDMILSHGSYDSEFRRNVDERSPFQRYRQATDPKARWVDGTPEYSLAVYDLLQLFSKALFIHILRDVHQVANSLMHFDRAGGSVRAPEQAYEEWYGFVRACVDAERAFGSKTVLRVRHADLLAQPESVVWRCLDFLGEPFSTHCIEPLEHVINSSSAPPETAVPDHDEFSIVARAIGLNDQLLAEGDPDYEPSVGAQGELKAKSPLTASAYRIPIDGPVFQEGPAAGFCDDFWVDGELAVTMLAVRSVGKVTVEGAIPQIEASDRVSMQLTIDGREFAETFVPGQEISWTVPCPIPRHRKAEFKLASSHTWCPKQEGDSNDERELAFFLKRIVFSP